MKVAQIWIYPVKTMASEKPQRVHIGPLGIEGDRVVHVEDAQERVITSRSHPRFLGQKGAVGLDDEPHAATISTMRIVAAGIFILILSALLVGCTQSEGTATQRPTPQTTLTPVPTFTPITPATPTPASTVASSPSTAIPTPAITPGPSAAALRWELVQPVGEAPSPRKDATLVYDDANRILWLFGGRIQGKETAELWAFDLGRAQWRRATPQGGPAGRWGHVAIFDSQRRQMVLFSGQSAAGFFDDTWLFDTTNQTWQEVAQTGDRPPARYGSCAGYDAARDIMYISHGFTNSGRFDDTWGLQLGSRRWVEISPEGTRPIKRCLHRCSYDGQSKGFYLFGGQSNEVPFLGDLWRFDPSARSWNEVPLAETKPSPRFFSALELVPSFRPPSAKGDQRGSLLVFGGQSAQGGVNDLWSFEPASGWMQLNPVGPLPEARTNHASALVPSTPRLGDLYIFGGVGSSELGELWRLHLD